MSKQEWILKSVKKPFVNKIKSKRNSKRNSKKNKIKKSKHIILESENLNKKLK